MQDSDHPHDRRADRSLGLYDPRFTSFPSVPNLRSQAP